MLASLSIRDIVLIDRLDLSFDAGLSALTGETGAGKSILLDAFSLALGARGDGGLVRKGAAQGQVTAAFTPPPGHAALRAAEAAGFDIDGDLILRRVQMTDGRTRAFVNDQPASVQALRAIGTALVEIHGQHDDRALLDAGQQRALLDAFGGLVPSAVEVARLHAALREAEEALAAHEAKMAAARKEADYLQHAAEELAKLAPEADEEEQLAVRRQAMMNAEKIAGDLNDAHEALSGQQSPLPMLSSLLRRLERRAGQAPELIEPSVKALDTALSALDAVQEALDAALRAADYDPRELERIEERLFALRGAARKYQTRVDALPALAEKFRLELDQLASGETQLATLTQAVAVAQAAYEAAATALSARRSKAAKALDKAVTAELPPLRLERARFITEMVSDREGGPHGFDRVEFHVQTNPGTHPGPMMRVASGGELSRFMLALKVVLAGSDSAPTLIFDEIDTGVGGAVADAIGQRLVRLAARAQVICVTHAPQVAARAQQHMLIAKQSIEGGKRVATRVSSLAAAERREEIARMLSGEAITSEARAAADRLLAGAV